MARQTEVVLLLILATASTIFATDFDKIVKEARENPVNSKCSTCCPFGWVTYEGGCFRYQAGSMDWASAEEHCLNLGGHLVSIHSENEYQLVKALIRSYDPFEKATWIGLSGCEKKFKFFWSDGTKLTFTKWSSGQPDFTVGKECCVHLNYGDHRNWNDIQCDRSFPFVCAKRFK